MKNIKSLIYDTLEKDNKDWTPKGHYPSSASFKFDNGDLVGPDLLDGFLKWSGVKPSNPSEASDILRMRLGDGVHSVLAKIFQRCGLKVLNEVSGKVQIEGLKHPISYRTDQLLEVDGKLIVLEVKSSTEQQMFGRGWGINDKGPKMDHLLQVFCYLELVPLVNSGRLLYIARDSGKMLEYEIEKWGPNDLYYVNQRAVAEVTWEGILNRWRLLEKALEEKKQPDPEYKAWINDKTGEVMDKKTIKGVAYKTDWRVLYSSYKDLIWKDPKNYKFTYNAQHEAKV